MWKISKSIIILFNDLITCYELRVVKKIQLELSPGKLAQQHPLLLSFNWYQWYTASMAFHTWMIIRIGMWTHKDFWIPDYWIRSLVFCAWNLYFLQHLQSSMILTQKKTCLGVFLLYIEHLSSDAMFASKNWLGVHAHNTASLLHTSVSPSQSEETLLNTYNHLITLCLRNIRT